MKKLSETARAYLNDPALVAERDRWFSRLQALFDGKSDPWNDAHPFVLHGDVPRPADDMKAYSDPEGWVFDCLELIAEKKPRARDRFCPVCVEYPIYGVHYIDKMFGADVFYYAGQWNVRYLKTPIGALQMPDLEKDETWQLSKRAAQAFLAAGVTLPLFGLPTLASPLNILVNLYGQEGLLAMYDEEDEVRHDLQVIAELIRTLHCWYLDNIPLRQLQPVISWDRTQPPGYGQICGCTTQLISADFYRDFILPLDEMILSAYPKGGMIHLCGTHTQHLENFRNMPALKAVQLNDRAAEDLPLYLEGLRRDQIIYLNPCEGMPAEKALALSKGERIVIVGELPAGNK